MSAPILEPITSNALPPEVEGAELFRVVRGGAFAGRSWEAGELMMCRGEPRSGDAVVLVSRGRQGRPRVGRLEGTRFLGEVGEPCHPARWRSSGPLVAAWRPRGERWVIEQVEVARHRGLGEGPPSKASARPLSDLDHAVSVFSVDPNQLSLFAA